MGKLGSASCKRKLSFNDTLQVHEIPRVRPAAADYEALRRAAEAAATAAGTAEEQVTAWREVAACMVDPALKHTYRACGVRKSLAAILQSPRAPPSVVEMAAAVLSVAAETFGSGIVKPGTGCDQKRAACEDASTGGGTGSADDDCTAKVVQDEVADYADDDTGEERVLCAAVISCLCSSRASNHTISSLASAILGFSWRKRFPALLSSSTGVVLRRTLEVLGNRDDLDVHIWKSLMTSMAAFQDAALGCGANRDATQGGSDLRAELLGGGAGLGAARVGVKAVDVKTLLGALKQFACEGRDVLPEAMHAFRVLCCRSAEAAAMFVEQGAAAVVKDLLEGQSLEVHAAAVNFLAVLAAPAVLSASSVL